MNLLFVEGKKQKIGYKANLGLGVLDGTVDNIFQPIVNQRIFAMRLLIQKDLLHFSSNKEIIKDLNAKRKSQRKLYFVDHIDSESKVILHSIKDKTFLDPGFEIYLRGVTLRLLAKFIDRYTNFSPTLYSISDREANLLNYTREYLMDNLFNKFPGVLFLADMAEMSIYKYNTLFKKIYTVTANNFFWREKMILTNELLKSGKFESINEVLKELGNIKLSYLSVKYYREFKRKPLDDFVKLTF